MNTELTETDGDNWQLAFPMDFGSTLDPNPNWHWIPPSPRPIFFDTDAETHTDWLFSGVVGESSDIVTDDLNFPTAPQNTWETEPKEQTAKVRLTSMLHIVLADAFLSNAQFDDSALSEMSKSANWAFVSSRTPSLANDLTDLTGLQVQFIPEAGETKRKSQQVRQAYRVRIEELRNYAELDDLTVNEASEEDFWSFIVSMPFAREAELVLLDNGNLRAIWDDEDGNHFGLQFLGNRFLGNRMLQYVIFQRRKGSSSISRVAGRDTFDGVKRQVRSFELEALLRI